MLLITGASESRTAGMGNFQDLDQVALARPVCKLARHARPPGADRPGCARGIRGCPERPPRAGSSHHSRGCAIRLRRCHERAGWADRVRGGKRRRPQVARRGAAARHGAGHSTFTGRWPSSSERPSTSWPEPSAPCWSQAAACSMPTPGTPSASSSKLSTTVCHTDLGPRSGEPSHA